MISCNPFHLSPLLRRSGSDWLRSRRMQERERKCVIMEQEKRHLPGRALWAYGYELAPPVERDRMGGIQSVLDEGHLQAKLASQTWEGRFVNGDHITHILVVCDSPHQGLKVNRNLEAELVRLEAGFSVTAPLEVVHGPQRPFS